ncbi:HNH endonuclease signature motif containing protein [Thalassospira sp. SN3W]|uniref:HNH endonuclease signature motif containing protein n=1 Tax=Thalassospira sp. SN3W TaxID=3035476 RepID=UPI00311B4151
MADNKRSYSQKTIKVLFALSGNQCAYPDCTNTLIEPATEQSDIHVAAQICHIYAISEDGPRGRTALTKKERNAPENLILLCRHHHGIVDDQHESYPADKLKEWKRAHEGEMRNRLSGNLQGIHPEVLSHPYFPMSLVDEKISEDIETLRKTRFFGEADTINNAQVLGRRLFEGELSGGSASVRSYALAWCSRLLALSEAFEVAEGYLALAKQLEVCIEIAIAEAFIASQKGDKEAALKILARINSSQARSAAFMVVKYHEGAAGAIAWLEKARIKLTAMDADGRFVLLISQLELAQWEAAEGTLGALTDQDFADVPAFHHIAAIICLLRVIPSECRSLVMNQLPLDASNFPLASDTLSMEVRKEALRRFLEAAKVERKLNCPSIASLDDDYALWLELRNPGTAEEGLKRLEDKLRDPEKALQLVPFGLQFGINLDLTAVEQAIEQNIAVHGGITHEAAIARLALAFTQKSPKDVADYIEHHYEDLSKFVDQTSIGTLQIEALSRAAMPDKAHKRLSILLDKGLSEEDEIRLKRIIAESSGGDPIELRKDQFKQTDSLGDLVALVSELEKKQSWNELCDYGELLFRRTQSVADAERLAIALINNQKSLSLVRLFGDSPDIRQQSEKLQLYYCRALFNEGDLLLARSEFAKISGLSDGPNYRALSVNIGLALGDWASLSAYVAAEYRARDKRDAIDLIQSAQLAHHLGSPQARDLTFAAAAKGDNDPGVLAAAYHLASTAGWEGNEIVSQWIQKAAELSGDQGPIQKMTLKDLFDQKPEWDRHETNMLQMLGRGDSPMFIAGKVLNRSLVGLMLFPALANLSERDPRRRQAIPAYSGQRQALQLDTVTAKVGIDATALLTLSFLNLLDEALDALNTVYLPHSTLMWLFDEKQKAAFHQPSRIRDAHRFRNMLATDALEKFVPSTVTDSDLSAQVGDDLAMLIAEAEKSSDEKISQRIVVRPSPVYRLGSLMEEEANLTQHASVITSCFAVVEKLRQKGQITSEEEKKARAYLQLHEQPWPEQPEISDDAELYLDDLAISHFLHLGMLDKLKAAGFKAIASPGKVSESDALISYGGIADKVTEAIEHIRSALNSRIQTGKIKVGRQQKFDKLKEQSIADHPTFGVLTLAGVCDAVIIDDRFVNQHANFNESDGKAAVFSTTDLLDGLVSVGAISPNRNMEARTLLRRAGYFFVPVRQEELTQYLRECSVIDGKVCETAEMKAIRENLLRVRMSDWLQLPKEASWLDATIKTLIIAMKDFWKSGTPFDEVKAISNWIVDQIDIRGWAHRFHVDVADDIVKTGRGVHILLLLSPPLDVSQDIKDAYWEWLEDSLLTQIKEKFPDLYEWIVNYEEQQISHLIDTYLDLGG